MALKSAGKLGPEKTLDPPPVPTPVKASAEEANTVLLELALYTNYTWMSQTFTKGKAYRFSQKNALQLLSERDHGRPVWKQYVKPVPKEAPKNIVVDAQAIEVTEVGEPIHGVEHAPTDTKAKRIDIGSEEELADLNLPPTTEGNVTV